MFFERSALAVRLTPFARFFEAVPFVCFEKKTKAKKRPTTTNVLTYVEVVCGM